MIVIEIGEFGRERVGIGAGQAGAAEHQVDFVVEHIGGDAAPQQLHHRAVAVLGVDAGPAQFQKPAGDLFDLADVVFVG